MGKVNQSLGGHRRGDEALDHMTWRVSFRAHISNEYYVTINSPLRDVDISRYLILSYGPSCVRVYPTGEGVYFDEWAHLVALIPTIHERHPELSIAYFFHRLGRFNRRRKNDI